MIKTIGTFSSLTKEQKQAASLLTVGSFLEYFDIMLYVHMAVLLNEIFFPKADPHTAQLYTAFGFCSTYFFRPFGALLFGYLGDNIGRKPVIIITTFIMAISCLIMAGLPTYEQIGVVAAWIVTICRIMQSLSCMGEGIGAEIYLTETTSPPIRYPLVSLIAVSGAIGTTVALAIASLVTSFGLNWRIAFLVGAAVSLIGIVSRRTLREVPSFTSAKNKKITVINKTKKNSRKLESNILHREIINKKTALSLFFIQCCWPACFYLAYIYSGTILKDTFSFTSEQVIHQNLIVSLGHLGGHLVLIYLCYKIYPLNILRIKLSIFSVFMLVFPYLLYNTNNSYQLLLLQLFIVIFAPTDCPAVGIFYIHFPVFKRFTYVSLMYALARALMSIIVSFGIVHLVDYFKYWGILIFMLPVICIYMVALSHFWKLDNTQDTGLTISLQNRSKWGK